MRALVVVLPLFTMSYVASADPASDPAEPRSSSAALVSAVSVGDWRKHAIDPASPSGEITPLLALDLRGVRLGDRRVRTIATDAALAGEYCKLPLPAGVSVSLEAMHRAWVSCSSEKRLFRIARRDQ
jgi:hypothetical protein